MSLGDLDRFISQLSLFYAYSLRFHSVHIMDFQHSPILSNPCTL